MTSPVLLTTAVVLGVLVTLLWLISLARRDASIVDPFWGTGFVVVAWIAVATADHLTPRSWLLAALTTVWGLRLSLFLLWRNHGKGEDYRYRAMREYHGARFGLVSFVTVFLLQGLLLWFISWPLQWGIAAPHAPAGWSFLDLAGGLLWIVGLLFESVGDWQLARFRADPANRGQVFDRGLWRYTRHPNYFGDFCVWWGLFLLAAAQGAAWTIASPLLMSLLLWKVSGVALLERTIGERRPAYAEYCRRTNAFFPGPPRRPR
ncbi:MAG: DUF1295 domain-containing protein [Pirellulales bacterium]